MNEQLIRKRLEEDGASIVGFCKLPYAPIKELPTHIYAISICYKLSDSVLKTITNRPSIAYFHHYRTVNAKLDQLALLAVRIIEDLGFNAFPIASSQSQPGKENSTFGLFQHKTAARLSGVGYIGKNAMLITKNYGSKVRLVTVLTDMPLQSDMPIIKNGCGSCEVCKTECPAGAIFGKNFEEGMQRSDFFDAEKCSNHMKTYNDVGRGAVCGICINRCPKNRLKD